MIFPPDLDVVEKMMNDVGEPRREPRVQMHVQKESVVVEVVMGVQVAAIPLSALVSPQNFLSKRPDVHTVGIDFRSARLTV